MNQQASTLIPVTVELGPELSVPADPDASSLSQFSGRTAAGLAAMLRLLGIPGTPHVELKRSSSSANFRLLVHGTLQPFSLELVQSLYTRFSPLGLTAGVVTSSWGTEIKESLPQDNLYEFLAELVRAIASQRPDAFLSLEQTAVYLRTVKPVVPEAWDFYLNGSKLNQVANVLRHLLRLKLSIANSNTIVKHIAEGIARGQRDNEIAEMLIPKLSPARIEIVINPRYLQKLAKIELAHGEIISVLDKQVDGRISGQFNMLADVLFYELGVRVPEIVFSASKRMKEQVFAIKLNSLLGVSSLGLRPDELLVNVTVDYLKQIVKPKQDGQKGPLRAVGQAEDAILNSAKELTQHAWGLLGYLGIKLEPLAVREKVDAPLASKAINPANGIECSIIDKTNKQSVEEHRLSTWDQIGYVILSLAKELRRNAWRLLHVEDVEYELAQLHNISPELALATMERISLTHLTRILRELLREEVSIRDLRAILERILTYDNIVADTTRYIVFDDRLAFSEQTHVGWRDEARYYAQHVRSGLKRYLTHKLTGGQNTLIVYLLDPDIEKQILAHLEVEPGAKDGRALTPEQLERIRVAIRSEVDSMPPTAVWPVVLTTSEIRAFVREIVADEFPRLFVASYDELSPDSNIEPRARISLSEPD